MSKKLFLPTVEEAEKYGDIWAKMLLLPKLSYDVIYWWLKSDTNSTFANVSHEGGWLDKVSKYEKHYIRPVYRISPDEKKEKGEGFFYHGYPFYVTSNDLAICTVLLQPAVYDEKKIDVILSGIEEI